jgi:elongation factor G
MRESAQLARDIMLEALAEADDEFMTKYLAKETLSPADIVAALRRATIELRAVPVLCGAARTNRGVQPLLDAIVDYLPSPADLPPAQGVDPETEERVTRLARNDESAAALAFKVMTHDVGQLTYLRVYSGTLKNGDQLLNSTRQTRVRVGRLMRVHANDYEAVDELCAGDIGAALKLSTTKTGDTLCDPRKPVVLDRMDFPDPVIGVAIEPASESDATRLAEGLEHLSMEDPTFRVRTDPETQQTIISGMGELHLEVLIDRLAREFEVQAIVGKPEVAYRETITKNATLERIFERRTPSGRGQFAQVQVMVAPAQRGSGFSFSSEVSSEQVPKEFAQAAAAGIREATERGILGGFPLTDIAVTLTGGVAHPVDSSELAFKMAGFQAFREAAQAARPALLEPLMEVAVQTPEEYVGDVIGDLNARRGKITGIEARSGVQVVTCLVPLAAMFGYATDLRSRTQGRATFSMQFLKYTEVPSGITEQIVAKS